MSGFPAHIMKIIIQCKECGEDIEVDYSPEIPAKINCSMEDSLPSQEASCDPAYCPNCNSDLDIGVVSEEAESKDEAEREDYYDRLIEESKYQD